ncbi:uroporphyrinogen-III synthase [Lonepinella koalarum]|uniref:Uroporphyrinogen-III synthase n=1 Tax=Lonepinella koalarum TaxID=53417 RepID=A0A4R1KPZ3_9PAST|nr:uroporphyrinogen-III synthase [Lonepinella koalarum]MDH2925687.1 uroporphyrinogen-III synthase [Lonepinella koalarum]TCK67115.1 uroporphyrinogen-III synthase [Lonepinella koalarum]TFJ88896.1 uroporphyrinogen-III synthase [Lonepinella koalarum]TYG34949.1 uroporphyrinogen-III synthase [Lonepinella koalarum]
MAVLITRPDQAGKQLAERLNKVGIANIHLPFFSISAGRELNQLPNKINQLKSGDYIFCVSKSAVNFAVETLLATGFQWREDIDYFAVGQGTAEYLASQCGITVHYPFQQENSEGVLNLALMQDLEDKNILILRGNGGREHFAAQAKLRGATINVLECYQRLPIDYNNDEQIDLWKRAGINCVLVTSAEILNALVDFVPVREQTWLKGCQLVTISRRIANLAVAVGWQKENIIIAPKADNATLVETLASRLLTS